jgi:hypothetical protein
MDNLHITEGVAGIWFYHLSPAGTNTKALCGAKTMNTALPLSSWGFRGHLNERYCDKCAAIGEQKGKGL